MKHIYNASDITEAHIVSGLLHANGIEAHVGGHYLQGGIGDLAVMDFASVHVADEDAGTARKIIDEYETANKPEQTRPPEPARAFTVPLLVIAICIIMMLVLAIVFNDQ